MSNSRKLFWVTIFAVSFALVESSVVVYLRALYYPEGFSLPLRLMSRSHTWVELAREMSTIIMLASAGILSGTTAWKKFAYFLISFGVWDIFYYVWLKVILDWPASILDWDVLFLIPVPWMSPVAAPLLISILMVMAGIMILRRDSTEMPFHANRWSWSISLAATAIILFSFVSDFATTLTSQTPKPYSYELLAVGLALYAVAMAVTFRRPSSTRS